MQACIDSEFVVQWNPDCFQHKIPTSSGNSLFSMESALSALSIKASALCNQQEAIILQQYFYPADKCMFLIMPEVPVQLPAVVCLPARERGFSWVLLIEVWEENQLLQLDTKLILSECSVGPERAEAPWTLPLLHPSYHRGLHEGLPNITSWTA